MGGWFCSEYQWKRGKMSIAVMNACCFWCCSLFRILSRRFIVVHSSTNTLFHSYNVPDYLVPASLVPPDSIFHFTAYEILELRWFLLRTSGNVTYFSISMNEALQKDENWFQIITTILSLSYYQHNPEHCSFHWTLMSKSYKNNNNCILIRSVSLILSTPFQSYITVVKF